MKTIKANFKRLVFLLPIFMVLGCHNEQKCYMPFASVDITLYTNLPQDNPALNNGYIIRTGRLAGYRGVIITSYAGTYKAFELADPQDPEAKCGILSVASDRIRLISQCTGAEYMMGTGMPISTGKEISPCPMKEYQTNYNSQSGVIRVFN